MFSEVGLEGDEEKKHFRRQFLIAYILHDNRKQELGEIKMYESWYIRFVKLSRLMFLQGYSKRSAAIGLLTKRHQFHDIVQYVREATSVTPIETRNKI